MKPRHAAALALVGWYLMMPPPQNVSSGGCGNGSDAGCLSYFIDPNTPLRKWQRVPDTPEFEYKTDCQHAIADGCHRAGKEVGPYVVATSFLTASLPTIRASRKNSMQLRHAAALALVGWYLMTPPMLCRSGTAQECPNYASCKFCRSDSQTPLREWVREPDTKEFEYKTDCQRAISDGCHSEVEADGTTSLEGDLCGADCIAADDTLYYGNPATRQRIHAVVGWYLLVPQSMNGSGNLNAKAPLAQWINEGAFDRADDCESARANGATATAGGATSEQQIKSLREMFAHAQCIGTDDPRLKPKVK